MATFILAFSPPPHPLRSDGLRDPIFVCRERTSVDCNQSRPDGLLVTYSNYLEQVLANEWNPASDLEAFKAGVIAIRTFADKTLGCGARLTYVYSPGPPLYYGMVYNGSQTYWFGDEQQGWWQNAITSNHQNARSQTDGVRLYRSSSDLACCKYFTDTGDPTQSCVGNSSGQCPGNSNDQYTLKDVPEPVTTVNTLFPGMSQNGSAAWAEGAWGWDYRQILTHYYRGATLANTSSTYYRWNWLNVGNSIVFTGFGGDQYYGPTAPNFPLDLNPGQIIPVTLYLQNTSRYAWSSGGNNPVRLGYHVYTAGGALVIWDDGQRGYLPSNIPPGEDVWVTINVRALSSIGAYQVRFDLVREGITWFSSQNSWPTLNTVLGVGLDEKIFLPIIFKNG